MGWATFWAVFSQTHLVTLRLGVNKEKKLKMLSGKNASRCTLFVT
jgi:hypothetical protein